MKIQYTFLLNIISKSINVKLTYQNIVLYKKQLCENNKIFISE